MQASQVDATITNEDSVVIPYVSGRMLAEIKEGVGATQRGALCIHNELGSNKSAVLPLNHLWEIETLSVVGPDSDKQDTDPEWFTKLVEVMEPTTVKKANNLMDELVAISDDFAIDRYFQVNMLIDKTATATVADESLRAMVRLGPVRYEILAGDSPKKADYRTVVEAQRYVSNGHILEVLLNATIAKVWDTTELDCSSRVTRDWRWLGAQYLTKNTRGNLFPQLVPQITQIMRDEEMALMKGSNEEWGALAALTSAINR